MHNKIRKLSATRVIALGFMAVILCGALLLMLPISSASGKPTGFADALFTATSATCVTGLVVFETGIYWTAFGKTVILILIQTGGLGFMTIATLVSFILRRRISFKERIVMAEALNQGNVQGIVRLTLSVVIATFLFEFLGAAILAFRFAQDFGIARGIVMGVFHSVSAFCNAGFDILGYGNSIYVYRTDAIVNYTLIFLIVTGGLGFYVWYDILHLKQNKRLHLHTKLVFTITALLIITGFVGFFLLEKNNMATLGDLPIFKKLTAALFQSVTARTAGFAAINQGHMTDSGKFLTVILMFIGGSPGSTAGGIKTVTFGVILFAVWTVIIGKQQVSIYKKGIPNSTVMRAIAVVLLSASAVLIGTFVICILDHKSFIDILFEVASAYGTTGLSTGITPSLCIASKIILVFLMFFGRVGILTFGIALIARTQAKPLYKYPEEKIMIG